MCGIAGLLSQDSGSERMVREMMDALQHRGPDDSGLYHGDDGVTLGHRRLSVIGLESGRQPISNEDGTVWIVFNGEIYNWRNLRADLEKKGHTFSTDSDTEVIVHLYEDHGIGCLRFLRGMFAFSIWDVRLKKLFLARDHLGQKPLFYHAKNGIFAFASEIKAILAIYPNLREVDPQALDQYLALRFIAAPLTMFSGIRKLPPAHYLEVDADGQVRVERYWDLSFEPKLEGSESDLLDELESLLIETLKLHLVSDVPVGAFLSGGIDSGLLVSMVGKHLVGEGLQTFSMGIPYGEHNEAPYARMVADSVGAEHHEYLVVPSLLDTLPDVVWHLDEPSDPLSVCTYLLSRETSKSVKVVLGGDGGDELFGGYDRYFGNLYVDYYARLPAWLRKNVIGPVLRAMPDGRWYKSPMHKLKWLHDSSFESGSRRYARILSYFYFNDVARQALRGPRLANSSASLDPYSCLEMPYSRLDAESPIDRMLYSDMQCRMPDHPVLITDRMGMAFGLEARSPYLDSQLAEFAAKLPVNLKIHGRSLRYLQVKLAQRYMPREVVERPKQGFSSAMPYVLKDEYRQLFSRFLHDSRLVAEGYLNGDVVASLLSEHLAGRYDHGNRLWLILNAEVWYRLYIDGVSREGLYAIINSG
jgi:asparagine synthase (glutamine-hydrolysing)